MRSPITTETSLYATDYQRWLEQTVVQLRQHQFNHLDLNHLIEELESLGRSEKHAISRYLRRLCEHLLNVKYWESERVTCFRGWDTEIANFRIQIQERLESSPSLQPFLRDNFVKQYGNGRKLFLKSSGFKASLVPEASVFTLSQALDDNWLPWSPESAPHT